MAKRSPLAEKLSEVRERIANACAKAHRETREVTLVAVTKTAAPEQIREILQLGVADLGESRVQVLAQRAAQINEFHQRALKSGEGMPPRIRWHMIGHLQRNKVKQVLPVIDFIHSIDSLRLAEEIDGIACRMERKVSVMLQVNASGEDQKYGIAVGASIHLAEQIDTMPNLQLVGLMAMGPLTQDKAEIRRVFARMREIFEEMKWNKVGGGHLRHLSMGMSNDFEEAIMEGATMVRIGSLLFGAEPAPAGEGEHPEPSSQSM